MEKDISLQLLLIIDYIVDWARDVYRPSILRQLKAFATGLAYDQVSLSTDSDIFSFNGRIVDWIPVPPTNVDPFESHQANTERPTPIDHKYVLPIQIPTTRLGSLRSTRIFDARIYGLRVTEEFAKAELTLRNDPAYKHIRLQMDIKFMKFLIKKVDNFLSISEEDLDYMEEIWTNDPDISSRHQSSHRHCSCCQSSTYFVSMEFSTYMKGTDWTIAKEITYLAISKRALDIFAKTHWAWGLHTIQAKARPCDSKVWRDTIDCLRIGSPWQHFRAAVSCVLVSLYAIPERQPDDDDFPNLPKHTIGFEAIERSLIRDNITRMHRFCQQKLAWKGPIPKSVKKEEREAYIERQAREHDLIPKSEQHTFIRILETRQDTSNQHEHSHLSCPRCRCMNETFFINKSGLSNVIISSPFQLTAWPWSGERDTPPKLLGGSNTTSACLYSIFRPRLQTRSPSMWSSITICGV